jgi:pyocin large subunit-like protein
MPLVTRGFDSLIERHDHWQEHHGDFEPPPCGEVEYEEKADAFLTAPPLPGRFLECTRANGRLCRYDLVTREYGVLSADGCLVTYFKPQPGVRHKHPTNEAYFWANC